MTTAAPQNILAYAEPATNGRRPWCRAAVTALVFVLAYPLVVAVPLVYAAHRGWLPQHFFCCKHPEVAALAFVAGPLTGSAWGGIATVRIGRSQHRPRPRGASAAALAVALGCTFAVLGLLLFFALKA